MNPLSRFVGKKPRPVVAPEERCELCAVPIGAEHTHVVNVEERRLLCTCRPCYLLFSSTGKLRPVPDRYRRLDVDIDWERLQLPVKLAFFFKSSTQDRHVAFYPAPAGAIESLLPLDAWRDVLERNPALGDLAPDVEALLSYGRRGETTFEHWLVPINACYELVGHVRKSWRGFDGGQEAWAAIDGFFAGLRARAGQPS